MNPSIIMIVLSDCYVAYMSLSGAGSLSVERQASTGAGGAKHLVPYGLGNPPYSP